MQLKLQQNKKNQLPHKLTIFIRVRIRIHIYTTHMVFKHSGEGRIYIHICVPIFFFS